MLLTEHQTMQDFRIISIVLEKMAKSYKGKH